MLKHLCHLQPKLTPQERLKLRMQKALNKQCEYHRNSRSKHSSLLNVNAFVLLHSTTILSAAKADKKAAQVKIQQQEHKRQVCFQMNAESRSSLILHFHSLLFVYFTGARRRATSHGTQDPYEVRLCVCVKVDSVVFVCCNCLTWKLCVQGAGAT